MLFALGSLGGAIFFYNSNALLSLFCLTMFVGACYSSGKLG